METRQGKSVFSGVAIGKLFIYKKAKQVVEKSTIEDPAAEVARYMAAKAKAKEQLEMLKEKTMKDVGEAEAEIFEAHQMLLEDLDFVEGITGMIENDKVNAEYAVFVTGEQCHLKRYTGKRRGNAGAGDHHGRGSGTQRDRTV